MRNVFGAGKIENGNVVVAACPYKDFETCKYVCLRVYTDRFHRFQTLFGHRPDFVEMMASIPSGAKPSLKQYVFWLTRSFVPGVEFSNAAMLFYTATGIFPKCEPTTLMINENELWQGFSRLGMDGLNIATS
jgi:hypothetical protein